MSTHLLARLLRRKSENPRARSRKSGTDALRFRPRLESLEDRQLLSPLGPTNVLGYHNDDSSTGQNLAETSLSPANVSAASFGKLWTFGEGGRIPVDGQVYAQPLYVSDVNVGASVNDVVYVATEHDSVYAIDAKHGFVIWHASFLDPAHGVTAVPAADTGDTIDLAPEIGITSTPVIDPGTNTLYVEAKTKEVHGGKTHYVHTLHALDLGSGREKFGGPAVIADTVREGENFQYVKGPSVNGTGSGSVQGVVHFNALLQHQRASLALVNGTVYIAYASHGDLGDYHGWVLGFDAHTLKLNAAFNTTPNGVQGGIWQGGGKLASDAQGNLYLMTGNGTFDGDKVAGGMLVGLDPKGFPVKGDYGDSFVKLAVDTVHASPENQNVNGWGLKVADYFTPYDEKFLDSRDLDLGSGGPLLLPDDVGSPAHRHLMIGSGKNATIYLIDRDNMGKFAPQADPKHPDPVVDEILMDGRGNPTHGAFDTPAYFNKAFYYAATNDTVREFTVANASLGRTPVASSRDSVGIVGATPSVSAHGAQNGIVWVVDQNQNELRAYDARDLKELYTSDKSSGRDLLGTAIKFSVPTVADGKVFVGTANSLVVYGLLPRTKETVRAGDGSSYQLETDGNLFRFTAGAAPARVDFTVQSIVAAGDGSVYDLQTGGTLFRFTAGAAHAQVDVGVRSIAVAGDGSVYGLKSNGDLFRFTAGAAAARVDVGAQSIAVAGDGSVYDLESNGTLFRFTAGAAHAQVDVGVRSIAVAGDGSVYDLKSSGTLFRFTAGAAHARVDVRAQSIVVAGDGSVYDLELNGNLFRFTDGAAAALVDSGVQAITAAPDGSVYDQEFSGHLYRFVNGRALRIH